VQPISGRLLRSMAMGLAALSACMLPNGAASAQQSTESTENYKYDVLGRLVAVETAGGQNDEEVHSLCYDAAGNRVEFKATSDGTEAACVSQGTAGGGSGGGGGEDPPPPPPPGNNPPVTQNDFVSGACFLTMPVNLTANDDDPEGNEPLTLTAVTPGSGYGGAGIVSNSSVIVDFGPSGDVSIVTYTVADSLGATSSGQLTISTSTCSGGGSEP
jgi:YD repeat-containing protein